MVLCMSFDVLITEIFDVYEIQYMRIYLSRIFYQHFYGYYF